MILPTDLRARQLYNTLAPASTLDRRLGPFASALEPLPTKCQAFDKHHLPLLSQQPCKLSIIIPYSINEEAKVQQALKVIPRCSP